MTPLGSSPPAPDQVSRARGAVLSLSSCARQQSDHSACEALQSQ